MARGGATRATLTTLVTVLVLGAAAYVGVALWGGDTMPRDARVEGIDVGGMSRAAAMAELDQLPADQPVTVAFGEGEGVRELQVAPDDAGLALDRGATATLAAGGSQWTPTRVWALVTGGDDVEAVVTTDDDDMQRALDQLESELASPVQEGALQFEQGEVTAVYGQPGTGVRRDEAADQLARQLVTGEVLPLPTSPTEPTVSDEAVDRALTEIGEPAVSAPVVLVLDGTQFDVQPAGYTPGLGTRAVDGELELDVDGEAVVAALERRRNDIGNAPVDARFEVDGGTVTVVPSEVGRGIDPASVDAGLETAVLAQGDQRRLEAQSRESQPELTTADAEALGVVEEVSSFTTQFPYAEYRNVNIGRAAELVDGTVLRPGETFSMNDTVGERTADNGFTEGFVIADGIFRTDLGGGVSQMATTLFNAMFFAGLEDVEHRPHSVYISRYPEGREATVAWGSLDLRFRNDTDHGVLIRATVDPSTPGSQGSATVAMYSTRTWDIESRTGSRFSFTSPSTRYLDAPDCEPATGTSGFSVNVYRDFSRPGSGEVERTEEFNTVYIPGDTVICGPDPSET